MFFGSSCDLAYQAFKIALSVDPEHAESLCNLGVLELQSRNADAAQAFFLSTQNKAPHLFQPFFNGALLAYKLGNLQDSFAMVRNLYTLIEGIAHAHRSQVH